MFCEVGGAQKWLETERGEKTSSSDEVEAAEWHCIVSSNVIVWQMVDGPIRSIRFDALTFGRRLVGFKLILK